LANAKALYSRTHIIWGSVASISELANMNLLLILAGFATMIDICQVKYLNNIIEQDHLAGA
jgi:transposase-like protein